MGKVRKFDTGATRDTEEGKLDYEGFLNPEVLCIFSQYMHDNRIRSDGTMRDSDDWQKGIPTDVYMKSLVRHFMEVWRIHRGYARQELMFDSLCGVMFNTMGYIYELISQGRRRVV